MLEVIKTPFGEGVIVSSDFMDKMRIDYTAPLSMTAGAGKLEIKAPTLPEICRTNIDAGHNTKGDWAAYIDACIEAEVPVLMDSFECEAGRGADVVRAGGEIGLWRQEPTRIEAIKPEINWMSDLFSEGNLPFIVPHAIYPLLKRVNRIYGAYDTVEEALADLLRAMTEYAHTKLKKSIIAQG